MYSKPLRLKLLSQALADVYGDILMVLMAVKRTFVTSKNKTRSEHPLPFYTSVGPYHDLHVFKVGSTSRSMS
jgi:hypothetical protein